MKSLILLFDIKVTVINFHLVSVNDDSILIFKISLYFSYFGKSNIYLQLNSLRKKKKV